jgi:hypothetical protein
MRRRDFLRFVGSTGALVAVAAGCSRIGIEGTGKGKAMKGAKLEGLKQPPFNTTMMGVVKGALDYHGIEFSAPFVFGASGHAFVINVHKQLCPSGPYCWSREETYPLIRNLGLDTTDLGFYYDLTSAEDRAEVEAKLRAALDKGIPCSLMNMEHQLITGYDADGLFTAQPWPPHDFPPARLTFGLWKEFGKEIHVNFYALARAKHSDHRKAVLDSLDYAVALHADPKKHTSADYGVGPDAYANWIAAAEKCGDSHGNWWNGVVWSECRAMASKYFAEIGAKYESAAPICEELSRDYAAISANLGKVSDKKLPAPEKIRLLDETQKMEAEAMEKVVAVAKALRS